MEWIDLRSDTVTHPTPEMRRAMAEAELGDDVFGDDPTVNRLQEMAAERMGMEAALFVASGTMGNLTAVLTQCPRGGEVILGDLSHQFINEAGGMSALGGIQPRTVANDPHTGKMDPDEVDAAVRPLDDPHQPRTQLLCLENTHNMCRGAVVPYEHMRELASLAHSRGLKLHIDGARIFNAAVALGVAADQLVAGADSVTFCLSKSLCAPVGSVLCGSEGFIGEALRMRKMLGGGMRQVGVIAAAGIAALNTMVDRLEEDHRRARALAEGLAETDGVDVLNRMPQSNMVNIELHPDVWGSTQHAIDRALTEGIRLKARSPVEMRLVTHYWIDDASVEKALDFFRTGAEA